MGDRDRGFRRSAIDQHRQANSRGPAEDREIAFAADRVEDVLQFQEAQELIYRAFGYAPTPEDLGNFASQSSIVSAKSASPAGAENA